MSSKVFSEKTVALHLPQELTEYHQHIKKHEEVSVGVHGNWKI